MARGDKRINVSVKLTEDQYNLARRKLFVEHITWQAMLSAVINAYIVGDLSVLENGRYHLAPPSSYKPVVRIEGSDVDIEPDWAVNERPQVGYRNHAQAPKRAKVWGTRELAHHLREVTGRRVSLQTLRKLLDSLDIPKTETGRWKFPKEADDPHIPKIIEAIQMGEYDRLLYGGVAQARQTEDAKIKKIREKTEANKRHAQQKRLEHLKRLRQSEDSEFPD